MVACTQRYRQGLQTQFWHLKGEEATAGGKGGLMSKALDKWEWLFADCEEKEIMATILENQTKEDLEPGAGIEEAQAKTLKRLIEGLNIEVLGLYPWAIRKTAG